jgi:hypothetical protein
MEKIICSAIKFKPSISDYFQIMCGKRHCNIFEMMYNLGIEYDKNSHIQGFLTDSSRFLDRQEAYELAVKNGVIPDKNPFSRILYSEDLWPPEVN